MQNKYTKNKIKMKKYTINNKISKNRKKTIGKSKDNSQQLCVNEFIVSNS